MFGCVGSSFLCEGFLQLRRAGATLHCDARASHYRGLSCCGAQAPDAQAQQLWLTGLVAPRHVGSSQTRARTRVPCIGRQVLNHCATREALIIYLFGCAGSQLLQARSSFPCVGASLRPVGSLVAACRNQFPYQGSNLGPPHWEQGVLTTEGSPWFQVYTHSTKQQYNSYLKSNRLLFLKHSPWESGRCLSSSRGHRAISYDLSYHIS